MSKRPRLSNHLRLAATSPAAADAADPAPPPTPSGAATQAAPPAAGDEAPHDDLASILLDATAEMTHLTWLGWNKSWEVQLRLARFWLGPNGRL